MDIRIMNYLGALLELFHFQQHLNIILTITLTIKVILDPLIWYQTLQCTITPHFSSTSNLYLKEIREPNQHQIIAKKSKTHDL